jgi:RNA polymerase sigma factor (sigma-70 family)
MSPLATAADSPEHLAGPPRVGNAELDRETLLRCCAHDRLAFRAFVVHYERLVFACVSRMLGRGPHVDDLAQDVFLRAYRAFPSFDVHAEARVSAWLLTIATRAALDAVERRQVGCRTATRTVTVDGSDSRNAESGSVTVAGASLRAECVARDTKGGALKTRSVAWNGKSVVRNTKSDVWNANSRIRRSRSRALLSK